MAMQLSAGDLAGLTGQTTASTLGVMPWIKQFGFWRNSWCKIAAPIVGLLLTLGWAMVSGAVSFVETGLKVDALLLYQVFMVGFGSGVAAVVGYEAQKPLGLLSAGPDNHPADLAQAQFAAPPSNTIPSAITTQAPGAGGASATTAPVNTSTAGAMQVPPAYHDMGI